MCGDSGLGRCFNVLERAMIVCENGVLQPRDLSLWPVPAAVGDSTDLDVIERRTIERVMRQADGNKARAAGLPGITRTQLYGRLRKYGIDLL
jgi:transcriptional regulator of acetoin/glycerol metabolism